MPSADADTAAIFALLSTQAGLRVADRYIGDCERLYDIWADFPKSGALRPMLGVDIRIGIVPPYIIIYRYTELDDTVRVLRIVHGRRRITGKLLRGDS